jgi:hypothetical protein
MIGFTSTPLRLQSITTAHTQWLSKTRSIPHWTTSVFSSTVTDLVLIYESVTSSASVVRWSVLLSWTLYPLTNDECRTTAHSLANQSQSQFKVKVTLRPTVSRPILEQSTHLGLTTRSWLLSDSCGFVDLGRPLLREDGSAVCNCYWPSPA